MRVLEVSLRKAGFSVTTAISVHDALDKLELRAPDLIISETTFPDGDGFELRRRVRATPEWDEIPFIFLTAEAAIENKIRGLELGVDDYLTKPIYIKEIVTRINILLQKRQRVRFEERRDGRTRFAGRVADMPVVDVIQTIEISRKSGVIQFVGDRGRQAAIYFRDGRVIDAEAGALQGEDAVYRLLTWNEGEFEVVFRTVRRREVIQTSSQGLLMEGMRRLDEWSRLLEQLPQLTHRFEVDAGELSQRLGDVPDDNNSILRLIDGKRTLLEVIDASDVGDLECLQAISRLYFEELLIDLDHGVSGRHTAGKLASSEAEAPTPIEDAASGPTPRGRTTDRPRTEERPAMPRAVTTGEIATEPGALMGGYRPSSLRLIDEAVAAAQAIEPSLFEDDESAPRKANGVHAMEEPAHERDAAPRSVDEAPEQLPRTRTPEAAALAAKAPAQAQTAPPARGLPGAGDTVGVRLARVIGRRPGDDELRGGGQGPEVLAPAPRRFETPPRGLGIRPSEPPRDAPLHDEAVARPRLTPARGVALRPGEPTRDEVLGRERPRLTPVRGTGRRPSDPPATQVIPPRTTTKRPTDPLGEDAANRPTPARGVGLPVRVVQAPPPRIGEPLEPPAGELPRAQGTDPAVGDELARAQGTEPPVAGAERQQQGTEREVPGVEPLQRGMQPSRSAAELAQEEPESLRAQVADAADAAMPSSPPAVAEHAADPPSDVAEQTEERRLRDAPMRPVTGEYSFTRKTLDHIADIAPAAAELVADLASLPLQEPEAGGDGAAQAATVAEAEEAQTASERAGAPSSGAEASEAEWDIAEGTPRLPRGAAGLDMGEASSPGRADAAQPVRGEPAEGVVGDDLELSREATEERAQASARGADAADEGKAAAHDGAQAVGVADAPTVSDGRDDAEAAPDLEAEQPPTKLSEPPREEPQANAASERPERTVSEPPREEPQADAASEGTDNEEDADDRSAGALAPPPWLSPGEEQADDIGAGASLAEDEDTPRPGSSSRRATVPDRRRSPGREDSGLRMIGSHGRDRAEASGELAVFGSTPAPRTETQRELVTILPRRITREMAVVSAPIEDPKPTAAREVAPAVADVDEEPTPPVPSLPMQPIETPRTLPPAPRLPLGSGVHRARGPGAGAMALIILAAILAGIAVYLKLRQPARTQQQPVAAPRDGGPRETVGPLISPIEVVDAGAPAPVDAGAATVEEPGTAPVEAGTPRPPVGARPAAAQDDAVTQARTLMDKAREALQEGDFAKALELVDASLKLRKTARTYLVRAQALQRLDRVDEALDAIHAAERLAPQYAAVYELRGRVLWAARRKDEARVEFERFLQLEPNGARAAQIRRLLNEPR